MSEKEGKKIKVVVGKLQTYISSIKTLPKGRKIIIETKKNKKVSKSRT